MGPPSSYGLGTCTCTPNGCSVRRMRLISYIRVSRLAGRDADTETSAPDQRRAIEATAKAGGHEIVDWIEDLDQSGGNTDRPGFLDALARVEANEADGVIVARLDRFARSVLDALTAIERLQNAGKELLSVAEGFDTTTPIGRAMTQISLVFAELERGRIRDNWNLNTRRTIERGVHISNRPPAGYQRRPDGGLEPNPIAAPHIAEAFRMRAHGNTWKEICGYLDANLPREGHWTHQTVSGIIASRTYLGEAHAGDLVNPDAHVELVTRHEWEAAQPKTGRPPARVSGALLAGLLRCAGCGHTLIRMSDGARGYANYRCRVRHADGICPTPARISEQRADAYVEAGFLAWLEQEHITLEASEASAAVEAAQTALDQATAELDAFRDGSLVSVIGRDQYAAGMESRAREVDRAQQALAAARDALASPLTGIHELGTTWPTLSKAERRQILSAAIESVVVSQAGRPGKGSPAADRAVIRWVGQPARELAVA